MKPSEIAIALSISPSAPPIAAGVEALASPPRGFGREVEGGFRRASARLGAREGLSLSGAAGEIPMFDFDTDYDVITPSGCEMLETLGFDARSVSDALSEDRARRCPDREAPADRS